MKRLLVGLAVVAVVGAGCSSGGSDGSGGSSAKATTTSGAATTTSEPAPADDQTPPSTINGIAVQGDTIWVASIEDDEILQIDRADGTILQRFDTRGAGPDDIAIAPDGSIWSAGFVNGDVGHIVDGRYSVATRMEAGINPIEFAPDGTLYIGTLGPDGVLSAIDTTADPVAAVAIGSGLPDINAFGIVADGTIVAPSGGLTGPSAAVAIDPDTAKVTTIAGGLPPVAAGTTDAQGRAYVLANITGQVIAVDLAHKTSKVVRTVKHGAPFDNLSFADDGTLYVSSFVAPTITEVATDGAEHLITVGG
ncbi:hypothetical protein [Aquihabitans sp. McL0605]|uniref:hypothetical protein n=1 Tax=Aquihabitans sp. McL0605 TaxID=3415671 RepID=UPI003CEC0D63